MSKNWSSYENDRLIMESWRKHIRETPRYSFLRESPEYILNEADLQEIFGKRAWEKLVDDFAKEDEGAADLAQRLSLARVDVTDPQGKALDVAQIADKTKQILKLAQQSGDPEVADAAQDLAQNVQQVNQAGGTEQAAAAAIADDVQGAPGEVEGSPTEVAPLQISKSIIQGTLKDPNANFGPPMQFRHKITAYLKQLGSLPAGINRNSPLIRSIVDIVRGALTTMGAPAARNVESHSESINKIFIPIILEEVRKEHVRRIIVEETKRVLNEKVRS